MVGMLGLLWKAGRFLLFGGFRVRCGSILKSYCLHNRQQRPNPTPLTNAYRHAYCLLHFLYSPGRGHLCQHCCQTEQPE
jgi:hypothetical protein